MEIDVNAILFGPVSALIILVFIVQSFYEGTKIEGRHVPVLCIAVAVVMMLFTEFAPERLVVAIANALVIAAAASGLVRYVKKEQEEHDTVSRSSTKRIQGDDYPSARVSRAEWAATAASRNEG